MSSPAEHEDSDDLPQRGEGEPDFLAEIYDAYGVRLYRAAARLLGVADAEDVVQELFVALARSRDRLPTVEHLPAYLFVSLRRLVACALEQRRRAPRQCDGREEIAATQPKDVAAPDWREHLTLALQALPLEQREVVILKIDGELTFAEIAQVLDIRPNTAASRYRYALDKLRARLSDEAPRPVETQPKSVTRE